MKLTVGGREAFAYTGGRPFDPGLGGVVFVHGALHDHSVWGLQSRYLAHHGHAVLAVDLPGHGRTPGPALGVTQAADWLAELVEKAGLQRTALVGHSMGSLIAFEAAARLGERASALVMIGCAYPMQVSAKLLELCQSDPMSAIDRVNALSISTHAAKPSAPGPGFVLHGGNRALMRRMQRGYAQGNLFHHDFQACDAYRGLQEAAARLRCPVSLVLGNRDQMTPPKASQEIIQTLRPQVTRLESGHHLMGECPAELLQVLIATLRPSHKGL